MTIQQNLVPSSKYSLKCPHTMSPIGICVHNTANDAPAKNEISYMVSNTNATSFHFAVDHESVWQGLPLDRNGWHAGDGANGDGNRKHIGIEICYSKSGGEKFDRAEDNAAQLIADLLRERSWGVERVKKHQDFSGKYCPHRTLDLGWQRFITKVKVKLGVPMANMYGTPHQYDLNNPESMKVAVDHLNDIQTGKYIKTADAEKALNDAVESTKKQYETQLKNANDKANKLLDNQKALAIILGLGEHATHDHVLGEVKRLVDEANNEDDQNSTPISELPTTYNGKEVVGVIIKP